MNSIALTVYFEEPFYVGVLERRLGDQLSVARMVFGPEPSDTQVYAWTRAGWPGAAFSAEISDECAPVLAANPKRRQRQIARQASAGISTRSQQALALAREQAALQRHERRRTARDAQREHTYELRRIKRRDKHRGH